MQILPRFAGIPGFGFLYSLILLLIAIPMAIIYTVMWGIWPWSHSVGIYVSTAPHASLINDSFEEPVIVNVQRAEGRTISTGEPELRLNSRVISWGGLRNALRAELSRRPSRIVYLDGDTQLEFRDIARVFDIAHDAWYGVTVVLLTPTLKKSINAEREGLMVDRSPKRTRAIKH
jgi:biopolymer transport protein ExbD